MIKNIFLNTEFFKIPCKYFKYSHDAPCFLLLHSGVLTGGNMQEKIMQIIFDLLAKRKSNIFALNFRKDYDGEEEIIEASMGFDYLHQDNFNNKSKKICLIAFDFGTYIAAKLIERRGDIDSFIFISPVIGKYDFRFFYKTKVKGAVIHTKHNSLIPKESTNAFINSCKKANIILDEYIIDSKSHFLNNSKDTEALKIILNKHLDQTA